MSTKLDDPRLTKRPNSKPVRRWRPTEMAAFEARSPLGTKQRTAYELMLNVGTARVDVHMMTWAQTDADGVQYTRRGAASDVRSSSWTTIGRTDLAKPNLSV